MNSRRPFVTARELAYGFPVPPDVAVIFFVGVGVLCGVLRLTLAALGVA